MSRLVEYEAGCSSGSDEEIEESENTQDREFLDEEDVEQGVNYRDLDPQVGHVDSSDEHLYDSDVEELPAIPRGAPLRRYPDVGRIADASACSGSLCVRPAAVAAPVAEVVPMASESEGAPAQLTDDDKGRRVRRWCFTWNNYPEDMYALLESAQASGKVTYVIVGKEVAPATGTRHGQGYCELKNPTGLKGVISLFNGFGVKGLHWLKCMGDAQSNIDYCSKDGDVRDWGSKPKGQGKRSDLDRVIEIANANGSIMDVVDQVPGAYIRYSAGIQKYFMMKTAKRNWPMKVYWLWGATGVGKSREAWRIGGEEMYAKDVQTEWWDGYTGQKAVILDDYRPSARLTFAYLLRLFDRYGMSVQMKGGTAQFVSRVIFVTCPHDIKTTFSGCQWLGEEDLAQMHRRVEEVHFTADTILNYVEMQDTEA